MARPAQGFDRWGRRLFRWLSLFCALSLAACGTKGFSLEEAAPDRSVVTGSIEREPAGVSDETTVRNAVSSAIVDEIGPEGLGWANVETGARGTIRDIAERRDGGLLCRSFSTTRESFEGVHLYRGEACLDATRQWTMRSFGRVE